MTDVATAAASGLAGAGPFVLVSGRPTTGIGPLVAAAQRHVIAPGPTTRLTIADGIELGGHRAVAVVDEGCAFADGHGDVAFTESPAAARQALDDGWSVVQPWRAADLAALLDDAPRPSLVLLADVSDAAEPPGESPPAARLRLWREGDLGTLAAGGAAVGALVRIGDRLHARGVPVNLVELATLTDPRLGALVGGDALYVGGPDAADILGDGGWPEPMERVPVDGVDDADLVGLVLAQIRTT